MTKNWLAIDRTGWSGIELFSHQITEKIRLLVYKVNGAGVDTHASNIDFWDFDNSQIRSQLSWKNTIYSV